MSNVALAQSISDLVTAQGKFNKTFFEGGAHYLYPADNYFAYEGVRCRNCKFFNAADNTCSVVDGYIYPDGACRLWVIENMYLTDLVPSTYVANTAAPSALGFDIPDFVLIMILIGVTVAIAQAVNAMYKGGK